MIKIAFCDDDLSVLRELGALMDKYRVERNQDIVYASFNSPLELLTEVERGTSAPERCAFHHHKGGKDV